MRQIEENDELFGQKKPNTLPPCACVPLVANLDFDQPIPVNPGQE
jgi:hypothetical protein